MAVKKNGQIEALKIVQNLIMVYLLDTIPDNERTKRAKAMLNKIDEAAISHSQDQDSYFLEEFKSTLKETIRILTLATAER